MEKLFNSSEYSINIQNTVKVRSFIHLMSCSLVVNNERPTSLIPDDRKFLLRMIVQQVE